MVRAKRAAWRVACLLGACLLVAGCARATSVYVPQEPRVARSAAGQVEVVAVRKEQHATVLTRVAPAPGVAVVGIQETSVFEPPCTGDLWVLPPASGRLWGLGTSPQSPRRFDALMSRSGEEECLSVTITGDPDIYRWLHLAGGDWFVDFGLRMEGVFGDSSLNQVLSLPFRVGRRLGPLRASLGVSFGSASCHSERCGLDEEGFPKPMGAHGPLEMGMDAWIGSLLGRPILVGGRYTYRVMRLPELAGSRLHRAHNPTLYFRWVFTDDLVDALGFPALAPNETFGVELPAGLWLDSLDPSSPGWLLGFNLVQTMGID